MSDRLLHKYTGRPSETAANTSVTNVETVDDLGAFGWLRGVRDRAIMLELRKKTGNIMAVGYSWIERVEFDPSDGITLHASGQRVLIKGRNLNAEIRPMVRLLEGIARHRVPWVQEAHRQEILGVRDEAVVVESIEW